MSAYLTNKNTHFVPPIIKFYSSFQYHSNINIILKIQKVNLDLSNTIMINIENDEEFGKLAKKYISDEKIRSALFWYLMGRTWKLCCKDFVRLNEEKDDEITINESS